MELEFDLELENGFPELAPLRRGDTVSLDQFLLWFAGRSETEAEDAALELERRGIRMDVSSYVPAPKSSAMGQRLALEAKLVREGRIETGLPREDALAITLEEYRKHLPLSPARAETLWQEKSKNGAWVDVLTQGSLYMVRDTAFSLAGKGVLLQDLMQEGCLGLWQTIMEGKAEAFLPAAAWRIREAMARQIALQAITDHAGEKLLEQIEAYGRTVKALLGRLGRTPSNAEVAEELGLSLEQTENLECLAFEAKRTQASPGKLPEQDFDAEQPVESSAYFALRRRVEEILSQVDERAREILTLRFGLDGKEPRTTEEIARLLKLTEEKILRLEEQAFQILRETETSLHPGD